MYVCNYCHMAACRSDLFHHIAQRLRIGHCGHRYSHQLSTHPRYGQNLSNRRIDILPSARCHALHTHRVLTTNPNLPRHNLLRRAAAAMPRAFAVGSPTRGIHHHFAQGTKCKGLPITYILNGIHTLTASANFTPKAKNAGCSLHGAACTIFTSHCSKGSLHLFREPIPQLLGNARRHRIPMDHNV